MNLHLKVVTGFTPSTLVVKDLGCPRTRWNASLRAPVSAIGLDGGSPSRANVLRPEADRNCAVARQRGEQLETNCRSAARANLIRPRGDDELA